VNGLSYMRNLDFVLRIRGTGNIFCFTAVAFTKLRETDFSFVTFCVNRRRRKIYCGHARLCVCLCVCLSVCLSATVRPHYCTDPDVTWRHDRGCPLVVHYWADLQSGHGLHCYGNITRTIHFLVFYSFLLFFFSFLPRDAMLARY